MGSVTVWSTTMLVMLHRFSEKALSAVSYVPSHSRSSAAMRSSIMPGTDREKSMGWSCTTFQVPSPLSATSRRWGDIDILAPASAGIIAKRGEASSVTT